MIIFELLVDVPLDCKGNVEVYVVQVEFCIHVVEVLFLNFRYLRIVFVNQVRQLERAIYEKDDSDGERYQSTRDSINLLLALNVE